MLHHIRIIAQKQQRVGEYWHDHRAAANAQQARCHPRHETGCQ